MRFVLIDLHVDVVIELLRETRLDEDAEKFNTRSDLLRIYYDMNYDPVGLHWNRNQFGFCASVVYKRNSRLPGDHNLNIILGIWMIFLIPDPALN